VDVKHGHAKPPRCRSWNYSATSRNARLDVHSYREREVLLRMVDGQPVSQIAVESVVSTSTVRAHVRSILTKLEVRSRLEAVSVARAAGLRPIDDEA
jgi:DNA-binding NarL/FixJ family response regulator